MADNNFDVLIVGAGLSGIGGAYHLQTACPGKTFVLLEARERLGGTWDLFRYPGIRSDSDMYTLGYSFRPWTNPKAIADGPSILAYLRDTAEMYGIDRKIRYGLRVERASWSSKAARWSVDVRDVASGRLVTYTASFVYFCSGYYDYNGGYSPEFAGASRFRGKIVHPQKWTDDIDYTNKRVVVIGSGATAVTLVPALAEKAAHVTMLQRSPTYIVSVPERDSIADWLRGHVPAEAAYSIVRWKNVALSMALFTYCRRYPERARDLLIGQVRRKLDGRVDLQHFTPSYKPWDQRLCLVPNGDLFRALVAGRASVMTDRIESFDETGILLRSGAHLDADLIVTATGLKLKFLGGAAIEVDGEPVDPPRTLTYKGMMLSGVPNLAIALGYTNASWTLKCDLTSEYVCRLLNHMDRQQQKICTPLRNGRAVQEEPLIDFSSGYVQRAIQDFPRQGSVPPWKLYQNYAFDLFSLRHTRVDDGVMKFSSPS